MLVRGRSCSWGIKFFFKESVASPTSTRMPAIAHYSLARACESCSEILRDRAVIKCLPSALKSDGSVLDISTRHTRSSAAGIGMEVALRLLGRRFVGKKYVAPGLPAGSVEIGVPLVRRGVKPASRVGQRIVGASAPIGI